MERGYRDPPSYCSLVKLQPNKNSWLPPLLQIEACREVLIFMLLGALNDTLPEDLQRALQDSNFCLLTKESTCGATDRHALSVHEDRRPRVVLAGQGPGTSHFWGTPIRRAAVAGDGDSYHQSEERFPGGQEQIRTGCSTCTTSFISFMARHRNC